MDGDEAIMVSLKGFLFDMTGQVRCHDSPFLVLETREGVFRGGESFALSTDATVAERLGVCG